MSGNTYSYVTLATTFQNWMNKTNNLVAELNNKVVKFDTSNSGKRLIVSANVVANGATFTSSANANFTGTLSVSGVSIATTYQTKVIERAALANTNSFIKSQLANTNSFIKSQLANTNTYIATKTNTSTFNSALANTNSFIKSQLANTNTYIATKTNTSTFNSALANTNSFIKSQLANTNTYIATKAPTANPTTTGLHTHTGRATISTNLAVSGNTTLGGLIANGSLGTSNYALKTNGTSVYWGVVAASGGSSGLASYKVVRLAYTANTGDRVAANTKGGQFAVTLPSSPADKAIVEITDGENNFANTSLIISRNGSTIEGQSANLILDVTGSSTTLQYDSSKSTWQVFTPGAVPPAVTSVGQSFTGGLISVAGSPITSSGTLALTVAGTSGGIPYFSSASAWATSAALTQYGVIYGGGAGATPVATGAGTTGQVLTANTGGAPKWQTASSGGGASPAGAIIYTALNFGAL